MDVPVRGHHLSTIRFRLRSPRVAQARYEWWLVYQHVVANPSRYYRYCGWSDISPPRRHSLHPAGDGASSEQPDQVGARFRRLPCSVCRTGVFRCANGLRTPLQALRHPDFDRGCAVGHNGDTRRQGFAGQKPAPQVGPTAFPYHLVKHAALSTFRIQRLGTGRRVISNDIIKPNMKRLAHYSQYFLRSPQLIKELVGHTSINRRDVVYDIGAGSGTISSVLSGRCQAVVAVEVEPRAADKLRENMQDYRNVTVYQGDFLTMPLPKTPYKIFANIPFHLSSPIVHRITEAANPPDATYLIVQKQFAHKLLPDSERFTGQLGMLIGPNFAVRIRRPLLKTDFYPHPNVDTVLIELIRRPQPLIESDQMTAYRQFIIDCFSTPKIFAKTHRAAIGLSPDTKPSQMRLTQWVKLFEISKK